MTSKKPAAVKCLLSLILSFSLLRCVTPPPDVVVFENFQQHIGTDPVTGHVLLIADPVCMKEIGEAECGHGVYIMTSRQIFVGEKEPHLFGKKPWSQVKRESIYLPAEESYAPLASFIINTCKKNSCSDQVTRFKVKLDSLKAVGQVLSPNP